MLESRHAVLSNNIANIDTPKFIAKDYKRKDKSKLSTTNLTTTNTKHIDSALSNINHVMYNDYNSPIKLNGNNVSLENESIKMSENTLEYKKTTAVYRKMLSMFAMVLKK
ncbi:MAG: hypothetical protein OEY79_00240 [Anaplasmataceae bacterium]|nr:hypothetical protein [Anaplasmataceae bacterium]